MNLHPDTLQFLKALRDNNHKPFFDENKKRYDAIKQQLISFVTELKTQMLLVDKSLSALDPKKSVFRINRDVRFSKDKSPYKTNMGCWMSGGSKADTMAGYYLHLEPDGKSFLAGGIYMPDNETLKKIRQEIDYNLPEFNAILSEPKFVSYFKELTGNKLKTAPKDYPKDHPAIELLKFKDYTVIHPIDTDETVFKDNFLAYCTEVFSAMKPLNDFLNKSL